MEDDMTLADRWIYVLALICFAPLPRERVEHFCSCGKQGAHS
jgi:hypothetical protein